MNLPKAGSYHLASHRRLPRLWPALPNAGYGGTCIHWIFDDRAGPYHSWGNGSAMRVSPVGWTFDTAAKVLAEAERNAEAMIAFLEANDMELAIRLAISLGGDSDTLACIAGGMAEACFGPLPAAIETEVRRRLPVEILAVVDAFAVRFIGAGTGQTATT